MGHIGEPPRPGPLKSTIDLKVSLRFVTAGTLDSTDVYLKEGISGMRQLSQLSTRTKLDSNKYLVRGSGLKCRNLSLGTMSNKFS